MSGNVSPDWRTFVARILLPVILLAQVNWFFDLGLFGAWGSTVMVVVLAIAAVFGWIAYPQYFDRGDPRQRGE